jgi:glycosyltransferase involved in cell wall biosynthesis
MHYAIGLDSKMKKIDVIILSNTADETYHNLLSITVNSIKAQTDVESNIILVETNTEYKTKEQYNLPIDVLVVPNEKFNFNRFLNRGLEPSTADYICFSNNDVRYFPNSLASLIDGLQVYDSVCPFGSGYADWLYESLNLDTTSNLENCLINASFLGWCYCFTRRTMNECFGGKFDEQFEFYRQDEDIINTLIENKFSHAVVGSAKAVHLNIKGEHGRGSNSYKLLGTDEEQYFYTEHPRNWDKIGNKWKPVRGKNGEISWILKK